MNFDFSNPATYLTMVIVVAFLYLVIKSIKKKKPKVGDSGINVINKTTNKEFMKRVSILVDTIKRHEPDEYRKISGSYNTIWLVKDPSDVFGNGYRHLNSRLYGGYCDGLCFLFESVAGSVKDIVETMGHEHVHGANHNATEEAADEYGRWLYSRIKNKIGK